MRRRAFLAAVGALAAGVPRLKGAGAWRAGVAVTDITPAPGMWMAGFAARTEPARGTALPLHAKALALEDRTGGRVVLVGLDLLGITAPMADRIAAAVKQQVGLPREALLLNASHTHCGPVVDDQLDIAYPLDEQQRALIRAYTADVERRIAATVARAVEDLAPVSVQWSSGSAGFAANRRVQFTPDGPVDHAVPVLHVSSRDDRTKVIVFGYACHNTTLPATFVEYHGDYAGVAQRILEARHPGATAIFVAGCGADANPKPRGTIELVEQHGAALADAVDAVLPKGRPLDPVLRTAFDVVDLPFAPAPGPDVWKDKLDDDDQYVRRHARLMLDLIARDGALPSVQPDPVQIWRMGDLTLVALGGEVVVDYVLRLRREHPGVSLWAAGYSNDVFGYVPSRRVLDEGGYEGGGAMLYYGKPGPFDESVESRIFAAIERLWSQT